MRIDIYTHVHTVFNAVMLWYSVTIVMTYEEICTYVYKYKKFTEVRGSKHFLQCKLNKVNDHMQIKIWHFCQNLPNHQIKFHDTNYNGSYVMHQKNVISNESRFNVCMANKL